MDSPGYPKSEDCDNGHHQHCDRDYCRCACHAKDEQQGAAPESQPKIDFENGKVRRLEGATLIDNPYPRETQGAIDWERGWKIKHYELLNEANCAAPCECDQLREKLAVADAKIETLTAVVNEFCEDAKQLQATADLYKGAADELRVQLAAKDALLVEAREALGRIAGAMPHASARRSARRIIAAEAIAKLDAATSPGHSLTKSST